THDFWHAHPALYGIALSEQETEDAMFTVMEAGSGNFEVAAVVLSDFVERFEINNKSLNRTRARLLPLLETEEQSPRARSERDFSEALFWPARFGHRATAKELAQIGTEEIQRWWEEVYRPKNAVLAVVGDIDPVKAAEILERRLGGWSEPRLRK